MKLYDGLKVACEIEGEEVKRALITEEDGKFFICQDVIDGYSCTDKKGFKSSWCIYSGSDEDLIDNEVTNLRAISSEIEYIYVLVLEEPEPEKVTHRLTLKDIARLKGCDVSEIEIVDGD